MKDFLDLMKDILIMLGATALAMIVFCTIVALITVLIMGIAGNVIGGLLA